MILAHLPHCCDIFPTSRKIHPMLVNLPSKLVKSDPLLMSKVSGSVIKVHAIAYIATHYVCPHCKIVTISLLHVTNTYWSQSEKWPVIHFSCLDHIWQVHLLIQKHFLKGLTLNILAFGLTFSSKKLLTDLFYPSKYIWTQFGEQIANLYQ